MTRILTLLVVVILVGIINGCVGTQPDNRSKIGILEGQVSIGPLCPVEPCDIPEDQKAEAYAERTIVIYDEKQQNIIAEIKPDSNGSFKIELQEGKYTVDLKPLGIDRSPDVPATITITAGGTVPIKIDIDTGMR
jgi:hypothetical protein